MRACNMWEQWDSREAWLVKVSHDGLIGRIANCYDDAQAEALAARLNGLVSLHRAAEELLAELGQINLRGIDEGADAAMRRVAEVLRKIEGGAQ